MRLYSRKYRHIKMSPRELYRHERAKYKKKVKKRVSVFGRRVMNGEYTPKLVMFSLGVAFFIFIGVIGVHLSGLVQTQELKHARLVADLNEQKRIQEYERNIIIPSEPVETAQRVAVEIAKLQNEYIIAIFEGEETFTDIDRKLEYANYLPDLRDCTAWLNLRDLDTLRELFRTGDYYWVGYADNTLRTDDAKQIPVFFVLYDSGYPVQIIEYAYDRELEMLRNRKDW